MNHFCDRFCLAIVCEQRVEQSYIARSLVRFCLKLLVVGSIGGGMIFKWGGGANFGSQKWRVSAGRRASATQGVSEGDVPPSDVGAFLKL